MTNGRYQPVTAVSASKTGDKFAPEAPSRQVLSVRGSKYLETSRGVEMTLKVGRFDVVSGQVFLTDPCRWRDFTRGGDLRVVNGRWAASVERYRDSMGDDWVSSLVVRHVDCPADGVWLPVEMNSDAREDQSGMVGVFDIAHFGYAGSESGYDGWCRLCRDRSWSQKGAGALPFGAVATAGYGGGRFDAFAIFDTEGRALAVRIVFIDNEDDGEN
jgi:hypothetical protein